MAQESSDQLRKTWRNRIDRQQRSGQTIAQFCPRFKMRGAVLLVQSDHGRRFVRRCASSFRLRNSAFAPISSGRVSDILLKRILRCRLSNLATVIVLLQPMIGKLTSHRPDDVYLASIQVQKPPIIAGQVEVADRLWYTWPLTGDSNRYQFLERVLDDRCARAGTRRRARN